MVGVARKSKFLNILLLALFLAVQVLGHAHAADHVLDGDNTFCSICSVTGHGGNAIVDSGVADAAIPLQRTIPACPGQPVPRTASQLHNARAPPLS